MGLSACMRGCGNVNVGLGGVLTFFLLTRAGVRSTGRYCRDQGDFCSRSRWS
jgi:hypothetical protein